jgi:hypothetical protein
MIRPDMAPRSLLLLSVPLSLVTCATTRGQAREIGAQALGCPDDDVRITSYVADEYLVEGCGRRVEVFCKQPNAMDRSRPTEGQAACRAGAPR